MSFSGRTRSALLLLSSENLLIGGEESLSSWYGGGDERKVIVHTLMWYIQRQGNKKLFLGTGTAFLSP